MRIQLAKETRQSPVEKKFSGLGCWCFKLVFPEHLCRRNRNPSIFENHVFLREMLKWHCPTPPNFFSDGQKLSFFG